MSHSQARKRHAVSLLLTVLSVLPMTSLMAQTAIRYSEQDGLLSVQASNTTASELAELLSRELGISVVVTGDAEARVNLDIIEEPLHKALARLSPNHLLVRRDSRPDSEITEVVLMMGEGSDNGGSSDEQFLPSGSPADDIVISDEAPLNDEGAALRDPSRNDQVRQAAQSTGTDPSAAPPGSGIPSPDAFDPITGLPIDPETGQPVQ